MTTDTRRVVRCAGCTRIRVHPRDTKLVDGKFVCHECRRRA